MAIQETRTLPPQFIEDIGTDLAKQLVAQTGVPVVAPGTGGITQLAGESADQFAARQKAAQQFDIRQQSLAGLAPTVAGQDRLQQEAQRRAEAGLGSFEPFLQQAQGASAATFDSGIQQQFMSPYQQQVIDTTLSEFDRQRAMQQQQISDAAVASGAFGGGREGVAQAEFAAQSGRDRAALQAGLLQQGFGQAQALAAQRFNQQTGLASLVPGLQRQDVSTLGSLGALNQAQAQAEKDALIQANRMAAFQPQEQLQNYGNLVTGIMGGMAGSGTQTQQIPDPGFLQTALGAAATGAGIYGALRPR